MKHMRIRLTATLVLCAMLIGMLWATPAAVSAADVRGASPTVTPDGIKPYSQYTEEERRVTSLAGAGTEADPHLISDAAEFEFFRGQVRSATTKITAYYRLTNDIVFNTDTSVSDAHYNLGELRNESVSFGGILDGDGHTIYHMYCNKANDVPAIFHNIASEAIIKNLNFDGVYLVSAKNASTSGGAAAILAHGDCNGKLENVHARNVVLEGYSAGGLVAGTLLQNGSIRNCSVENVAVNGYTAGGIVNSATGNAVIEGCTVSGRVSGSFFIGGICGYNTNDNVSAAMLIKKCINRAEVVATTSGAGILGAGQNTANNNANCRFEMYDCINYGAVTTQKYAGGMVGTCYMSQGQIKLYRCVNKGDITAETNATAMAGGMFARIDSLTSSSTTMFTDCVNDGTITSNQDAGGMLGQCTVKSIGVRFTNCMNTGTILGHRNVGGFIGYFMYGTAVILHNSANVGDIGTTEHAVNAGGFFGSVTTTDVGVEVNNGLMMANVSGKSIAGAIAGYVGGSGGKANQLIINNAWVQGTITSGDKLATYGQGFALAQSTKYGNFNIVLMKNDVEQSVSASANIVEAGVFTDGTVQTSLNNYVTNKNANLGGLDPHIPWARNEQAEPTHLTTLGFSGATMSLGSDMALNMKLDANSLTGLSYDAIHFVKSGDSVGVEAEIAADGYYTVSYTGIRAAALAEEMQYTIVVTIDGTAYTSTNVLTYSPATYLINLYNNYHNENEAQVDAVAENMLYYGAAAEAKANGIALAETKTYAMADAAGITLPKAFTATDYTNPNANTQADKDIVNANAKDGVGMTLTGGVHLTLNGMTPGQTVTVRIRGDFKTYVADDSGMVEVDIIYADMIMDVITLAFAGSEPAYITIGNLLEARRADASEQQLAEATILYMLAVRAYTMAN